MIDPYALITKNYPEFGAYRDIIFYAKMFLNPDIRCQLGVAVGSGLGQC